MLQGAWSGDAKRDLGTKYSPAPSCALSPVPTVYIPQKCTRRGPCPPGAPQKQGKQMQTSCNSSHDRRLVEPWGRLYRQGLASIGCFCLVGLAGPGDEWLWMAPGGGGFTWCHGDSGVVTLTSGLWAPVPSGGLTCKAKTYTRLIHLESSLSSQQPERGFCASLTDVPRPFTSVCTLCSQNRLPGPNPSPVLFPLMQDASTWGVSLFRPWRMRTCNLWSAGDRTKRGTWEETSVSHQQMDLTTANPTESKKKQTKATTNETTPSGGSSGLKSPEDIAELYPALEVCHKSSEPAGKDETMFCVPHSLHAAKNNTNKIRNLMSS